MHKLLIAVEAFGMLGCLLVIPILFIRSVYLFSCQRFTAAIVALFLSCLAFAVFGAVMVIDPCLISI